MNISMYSCYAAEMPDFSTPAEAFRHCCDKGVRYADMLDPEFKQLPLHLYCDYLREGGITPLTVVSMENILSLCDKKRRHALARVKGLFDQAEKEKASFFMLAPAPDTQPAVNAEQWKRVREHFIKGLAEMIDYANGSGIKICIENLSSVTRPDSKIDDIRYLLDTLPELGYVFDAGNFFCVSEDAELAYDKLCDRMVHAHFKDWAFDPFGLSACENMPRFSGAVLGQGELPLAALLRRMKQDDYQGSITIEINSTPTVTLSMLDASIDFLRSEMNV